MHKHDPNGNLQEPPPPPQKSHKTQVIYMTPRGMLRQDDK